jgi:hypothetical protein
MWGEGANKAQICLEASDASLGSFKRAEQAKYRLDQSLCPSGVSASLAPSNQFGMLVWTGIGSGSR